MTVRSWSAMFTHSHAGADRTGSNANSISKGGSGYCTARAAANKYSSSLRNPIKRRSSFI